MKIRYAAAAALVQWYLILAPPGTKVTTKPFPPFSQWVVKEHFEDAYECARHRSLYIREHSSSAAKRREQGLLSACISSQDPRLKPSKSK